MCSNSMTFTVELTKMHCKHCGGVYAVSKSWIQERRQSGGSWNCPYCDQTWHYTETDNIRLERELATERQRLADERGRHDVTKRNLQRTEYRRRGAVGAKTRITNKLRTDP